MNEDYDLKASVQQLGILVPIIKNKRTGHTVDGKHRSDIDPKAPVYEIDIPEELEPLARLAINKCRRDADQDEEEWRDILSKVVGIQGKKPQEIADQTGISLSTIYRHLPQEMKDDKLSKTISEGMQRVSEISRQSLSPDRLSSTIQDTVQCDRCHVSTSTPVEWHNHNLCESCHDKALANPDTFNSYFSAVNKKPEPHTVLTTESPRSLDSWEQRKAQMSPQHSKRELEFVELCTREDDLRPVITDRSFPLEETIPDAVFPKYNAVAYVDDPATHSGSRMDKDEVLREKFLKRNPGWQMYVFRDGKPEDWVQKLKLAVKVKMEV